MGGDCDLNRSTRQTVRRATMRSSECRRPDDPRSGRFFRARFVKLVRENLAGPQPQSPRAHAYHDGRRRQFAGVAQPPDSGMYRREPGAIARTAPLDTPSTDTAEARQPRASTNGAPSVRPGSYCGAPRFNFSSSAGLSFSSMCAASRASSVRPSSPYARARPYQAGTKDSSSLTASR